MVFFLWCEDPCREIGKGEGGREGFEEGMLWLGCKVSENILEGGVGQIITFVYLINPVSYGYIPIDAGRRGGGFPTQSGSGKFAQWKRNFQLESIYAFDNMLQTRVIFIICFDVIVIVFGIE